MDWKKLGKALLFPHIAIMIIAFILRAVASMLIGWIAYPVVLVYHIVMVCRKSNE